MKILLLTLVVSAIASTASAIVTPPSQSIPAGSTPRNPIAPSNEQFCVNASRAVILAKQASGKIEIQIKDKKNEIEAAKDAVRKLQDELKQANDQLKKDKEELKKAEDEFKKAKCQAPKAA